MKRNSFKLRMGALTVALIGASLLTASASGMGITHQVRTAGNSGPPTLVFLHNGAIVGKPVNTTCGETNAICNVIEFDWKAGKCFTGATTENPPVVTVLSTSGVDDGRPEIAPCAKVKKAAGSARRDVLSPTNDVEYIPTKTVGSNNQTETIAQAWWTYNGITVSKILPPEIDIVRRAGSGTTSAPDTLKVYLNYASGERLKDVKLRNGNKVISTMSITAPKGTNEVEWFGYTPTSLP